MDKAIEWFVALTAVVMGVSHLVQAGAWREVFERLRGLGRTGAFINGGISLFFGSMIVAGHPSWAWPEAVLTAFGWLQVVKGTICLIVPAAGTRSMALGTTGRFRAAGCGLILIGAWAGYCAMR